ncbi:MAG: 30S ribosomal protein S17 [Candidatus Pacearchaeota archaeon]|nr:30S ribosomal protein S17 [Candidatus Pacearchaeota archaeon]
MAEKIKKENKEEKKRETVVGTRGRIFAGKVVKKFDKRVAIEFERTIRIPKYERFSKRKTRLHARIPENMEISVGDYVKVRECRPLSKMIHFVVIEVLENTEKNK